MNLRTVLTAIVCYALAGFITCVVATAASLPFGGRTAAVVWVAAAVLAMFVLTGVADRLTFRRGRKDGAA